ncbi:MAG: hypothetical protein GX597_22290 [Anaerolineaceae bacterium]|nr:hypothetical protein [Anaerolineaceae bacterium]
MSEVPASSGSPRWKEARRAAFLQDALATLMQHSTDLLSFEQVSRKLRLEDVHYADLQDVPLDQIAGSVGRYSDFTRAFFPRRDHLQQRWEHIERVMAAGRDVPPVELYRVGEIFFVRDGNHRVSVARQLGRRTIKAHVWEYDTLVPLRPDSDVDETLSRLARDGFLEQTHIDRLRPALDIQLTQAGGYEDLLCEIKAYQHILSDVDQRELSLEEAAAIWCDIRYEPIVQIMRERQILGEFPRRTEADLYLWLSRNREELEAQAARPVLMGEAAEDLARRYGDQIFSTRRLRLWARRAADRLRRAVAALTPRR